MIWVEKGASRNAGGGAHAGYLRSLDPTRDIYYEPTGTTCERPGHPTATRPGPTIWIPGNLVTGRLFLACPQCRPSSRQRNLVTARHVAPHSHYNTLIAYEALYTGAGSEQGEEASMQRGLAQNICHRSIHMGVSGACALVFLFSSSRLFFHSQAVGSLAFLYTRSLRSILEREEGIGIR